MCKFEIKKFYKVGVHMLQLCIFSLVLHKKYIYFANKKRKKELNRSLVPGLGHGGDSGALLLPGPSVDLPLFGYVLMSPVESVSCQLVTAI